MRVIVTLALLLAGCASLPGQDGGRVTSVEIESTPAVAWIFVDGAYAGRTPLTHRIELRPDQRYVEIVAVPERDGFVRQVVRLSPPTLPSQVTFFLDNPDPRTVSR